MLPTALTVRSRQHGQGKNTPLGRPGEDYFAKEIEIYNHLIIDLREKYNLKVNVFAHSMGSFITQGLIEKYSYNIDRTILCGSNGRNGLVKIGYLLAKIIVNDKNKDKDANLLYKLSIGAYEKTGENYHGLRKNFLADSKNFLP